MGKSQRDKGKRFEQRVAKDLRAIYGQQVKRGWQARAGSADAPDIEGTPWSIECKDQQSPSVWAALKQAQEARRVGQIPVAVCKRPREEPVVVMGYNDWVTICRVLVAMDVVVLGEAERAEKETATWTA